MRARRRPPRPPPARTPARHGSPEAEAAALRQSVDRGSSVNRGGAPVLQPWGPAAVLPPQDREERLVQRLLAEAAIARVDRVGLAIAPARVRRDQVADHGAPLRVRALVGRAAVERPAV